MLGICLKYEQVNYGSKLQALATVQLLRELGLEYEIIHFKKDVEFYIKSLPRFLNWSFLNDRYDQIQRISEYRRHPNVKNEIDGRGGIFAEFDTRNFRTNTVTYGSYNDLKAQCESRYDCLLTCSDQLWSPAALGSGFYNLMFAPEQVRKVSWASSFGVSQIPWYQKKRTRAYLNRIQHISMRENRGAEIVKELTGREVPVLMDPVFVFDKNEWDHLIPGCEPEWEPYIFCYFLGDNPEHRAAARELAAKTGKKIVTLRHLDRYVAEDENFGDYAPYDVDPQRFLNILRNADCVCTDSFHGSAFSILCEKQFLVFNRYRDSSSNSKNSRIDSLCENLGLEDRRFFRDRDVQGAMEKRISYLEIQEKLRLFRNRTKDYLIKVLMNDHISDTAK